MAKRKLPGKIRKARTASRKSKSLSNLLTRHGFKPFRLSDTSFSFSGPGVAIIALENVGGLEPVDAFEAADIFEVAKRIISESRMAGDQTIALLAPVSENKAERQKVMQELRAFCSGSNA
ncbi:MAG: hypothetical protein ACREXR_22180 [Gammaproteobacteria bacterium]